MRPSSLIRALPLLLAAALGLGPATGSAPTTEQGLRLARKAVTADDMARVIVQYRSDSTLVRAQSASSGTRTVLPQHAATMTERLGVPLTDGRILGERVQAMQGSGLTSAELVTRLQAQPEVEWAVIDHRRTLAAAPNDPYYAANQTAITPAVGQWYLRQPDAASVATGTTTSVVASINAEAAWAITTGSPSITVAVLDTGVRFDHPDFTKADGTSKLWPGYDFVLNRTNAPSYDGDGRDSDPSDPGDYTTSTTCGSGTTVSSSSWHGTQTASLVGAATDNGIGMASIGRNVKVLPVRVLGPCGGYDSDIVAAMQWAAGISIAGSGLPTNPNPAQVISMSLGGATSCNSLYNDVFSALAAKNVTVVVAAGNEAGLAVDSPANCSGALAVAGVRHVGTKVGYSNVGPEVAIAAPAGNCVNTASGSPCLYPILTAINKGSQGPTTSGYSDSYSYSVGTSFATPLVAGTVGLMLSVNPSLTPAQVKSILQTTARTFPTTGGTDSNVAACRAPSSTEQLECYCTTSTCGAGLLDAGKAVAAVPAAVAAPTVSIGASASTVTAGATVTLTAQNATANGGRSIAGYSWAISSGSGSASFSSATTSSTATLLTSAAGSVVVTLTVTDSAGAVGTATSTITVQAATSSGGTSGGTASSGGGGGGGGAMSAGWVALLGLAAAVLQRARRRNGG